MHLYIKKTGPKQQDKPAKEFVLKLYMAANPDPERQTYSHFTTATGVFKMKKKTSSALFPFIQNKFTLC